MKKIFQLLSCLFFMQISVFAQEKIQHIEPLNWWVGMKNPNLQLLVHRKNIADFSPKINYKGVSIKKVNKVENPNYLFIDLLIAPETQAGEVKIIFENNKKETFTHHYSLLKRQNKSADRIGFNSSDVLYMITPDRFANGNPQNDNVANFKDSLNRKGLTGRHGGDIEGIIQHLDYIQNLGMTALWINPLVENNQPKTSYHGYAITNFSKIDARFGTNDDYVRLSKEAKKHGIKLVMDMVLNHCGSEHWWMKDFPTKDWINFQVSPKTIYSTHRRESLHDPYAAEYDITSHSDGWFDSTMPDLNQRNPFMANYLIQNSIWWVEYADLGGIRMDTWPYPDKNFMSVWSKRMEQEYPNFNIVGEEWSLNPSIVAAWQKGKVNKNGYVSYLRTLMDFPVNAALIEALNTDEKVWNQGFTKLYQTVANDFVYANPNDLMIFPDNHDMSRFFTQLHEDYSKFKNGMAFLLTTRGIPQIYYGTEILMTNPKSDEHGEIRGDMPGGWADDSKNVFTEMGMSKAEIEAKNFVSTLLKWRKNTPVIHSGKLKHFAPANGFYVQFRYNDKQKIMVILNKNKESKTLEMGKFKEILKDNFIAKDILSNQTFEVKGSLNVPPNNPLILEITEK
ncbi:glycoside hydrolase family 13 protein [Arcicella rosea]|uniref:Glycosidase n=1 Tax=Arcicella rosea TaxID=502909 RepID=A0A841ENS1_9BACT|nr:glycoside hydrolase family 13 protein [Arcicella rosea]MBB6002378.1 glycosidase [Arcicella rosea]